MNRPFREMQRTDRAQILIGTMNISLIELLREEGIHADIVLGHSAGELSSLYASGAIDIEDVLWLIVCRGRFMYDAAKNRQGKMIAVMNQELEDVLPVMQRYQQEGTISLGNYNSPQQFVITGDYDTVTAFEQEMNKNPAVRIEDLRQQGAWHSTHMAEAQGRFAEEIEKIKLRKPSIPMIFNHSAEFVEDAKEIKLQLANVITSTVNWYPCLCNLTKYADVLFAEVGPNKILRGLLRRSYKALRVESYDVVNVNDIGTLGLFRQKLKDRRAAALCA
jgi:[acyl-carrier-protein] S-malonyltransferase